jgi:lipocalin
VHCDVVSKIYATLFSNTSNENTLKLYCFKWLKAARYPMAQNDNCAQRRPATSKLAGGRNLQTSNDGVAEARAIKL